MKILIVNTSERTGGAAVAANRLMKALNNSGVKAKMLVRDKESDTLTVAQLPKSPMKRWHFLWERLVVFCHLHFSKQHLFEIDIANAGTDITKLREFEEADIIQNIEEHRHGRRGRGSRHANNEGWRRRCGRGSVLHAQGLEEEGL